MKVIYRFKLWLRKKEQEREKVRHYRALVDFYVEKIMDKFMLDDNIRLATHSKEDEKAIEEAFNTLGVYFEKEKHNESTIFWATIED